MKMKHVDQTHPQTNQPFWPTRFEPAVVPDGGRKKESKTRRMEEVEHESPNEGTDRSFERGSEAEEESDE